MAFSKQFWTQPIFRVRFPLILNQAITCKYKFCMYINHSSISVSHSVISDSTIPWTVACQAPLSTGFSRQENWSGLPFPSTEDLPDPGIEPRSPALAGRFWEDPILTGSSVQSLSLSDSLRPHGLQHARPPCPSPAPGFFLNSCPLSQ